jgi:hypothetical protein
MYFDFGESVHIDIAGLIVESCQGKITLLSAKKLHKWLQHVLLITRYIFFASLIFMSH